MILINAKQSLVNNAVNKRSAAGELLCLMQTIHSLITTSATKTKDWSQNDQADNRRFSSTPHRLPSEAYRVTQIGTADPGGDSKGLLT